MSFFQDSEFYCKCGKCPQRPPDALLRHALDELRGRYGKPIFISSGWRCEPYNATVGGDPKSSHLTGKAADLYCTGSADRFQLLNKAVLLFRRIGIGQTFLHVDTDKSKDQGVIWLYGNH